MSLGAATLSANQSWANNSSTAMTTAGILTLTNQLSLTAGTFAFGNFANTGAGGVVINGATAQAGNAAAFGTGTLTLTSGELSSDGTTARAFANALSINGSVRLGDATNNGALTFSGTKSITGSNTINLDGGNVSFTTGTMSLAAGSNTTFSSAGPTLTMSGGFNTNGGTDTLTLNTGANAVTLSGAFTGTAGTLVLAGSGTNVTLNALTGTANAVQINPTTGGVYTFSGASTYTGATTVSAGKLLVTGSLGGTAIAVSGGASLGGTGTIGTTTAGTVTLANGTSDANRGAIDLTNGAIGTLNFAAKTGTTTVLTIGGTGTNSSILSFDVGNTADQIALGSNARLSIGAGGGLVRLTGIGNLSGTTQTLISSGTAAAAGSLNSLTLDATTGNFSGYTVALAVASNSLTLTETANAAPTTAYWKGTNDGVWDSFTGGNTNISNFATNPGGTNATGKVGATTDVIFNATTAANFASTTLGENLTIKSLTFGSNATSSVGIGGSNTLTITPATPTTGVTVATGSANHTISSLVALGANQT